MDKSYWTKFYAKCKIGDKPSLFAQFVLENYLLKMHSSGIHLNVKYTNNHSNITKDTITLLELGCGNGRDALFFAKNKIKTTAIDQVVDEINYLTSHCSTTIKGMVNPHFIAGDFTDLSVIFGEANSTQLMPNTKKDSTKDSITFDCIYSRFTLHSITHLQQENLLSQIPLFLAPSGIIAIEARGEKNSLYKQGKPMKDETNAFIRDGHYRRFVNFEHLCEVLESQLNLTIHFAKEDKGFAPFKDEDDFFVRVIAMKT